MSSGLPDAPSWWAEPGRPGYAPYVGWGLAAPWTLAGHVLGAWAIEDPWRARESPFPGVVTTETPLAWTDSLIAGSGGAAWGGFEGALSSVQVERKPPLPRPGGRARAVGDLVFYGGSSAYDGNALAVSRGDSLSWLRVGAVSWNRGGLAGLAPAGRHHYDVSGAWTRGRHRIEALIGQAGSAAALVAGEQQAATGAGGSLRYALGLPAMMIGVEMARGYDHHESFGGLLAYSRRDAHQRRIAAEASAPGEDWAARIEVRDAWVSRVTDLDGEILRSATSVWAVARGARQRGPARVEGALGVGRHDAVPGTQIAPSLALALGGGALQGRISLDRVLTPVWSDLAPGETPFLQSSWVGGIELASVAGSRSGRLGWRMGRTRGRAVAKRLPFEELWLREGFARDPDPYDFGLATAAAALRWRSWTASGEGYVLFRDDEAPGAAVDPRRGGRVIMANDFHAFHGDLGIRWSGDLEVVGGRASEASPSRWIPGFASFGASAAVTLADAVVTLRLRNLEDRQRAQTWVDPLTGVEALGEGLEFRLGLAWRLYN